MSNYSFLNLNPSLNDSTNVLLAKMLARLQLNANTAIETPAANVAVTNLPLPVTFPTAQNVNVANTPTVNANITNASLSVEATNEMETIAHEHEKVHNGEAFWLTEIVSIANGATYYWMISTPAAPTVVHLDWKVIGTVAYTFGVYETPTTPVGGVAWTPVARNRHLSVPNVVTGLSNLSVAAPGTFIRGHRNSGSPGSSPSPVRGDDEVILAHSTNYLFAITAHAPSGFFTLQLSWYLD